MAVPPTRGDRQRVVRRDQVADSSHVADVRGAALVFEGESGPRAARRFVQETVKRWGEPSLAADAAVIVSELTTNALVHAHSPFRVEVTSMPRTIRIGVEDSSDDPPEPRGRRPTASSGRGLVLVAKLSAAWGVEPTADGKLVWADLAR